MGDNLVKGVLTEIDRVNAIIKVYEGIESGQLALIHMNASIKRAKEALGTNDVFELLEAYEDLKGYSL